MNSDQSAVDFTQYDYIEFDVYVDCDADTPSTKPFLYFRDTNNGWSGLNATQVSQANQWQHIVFPIGSLNVTRSATDMGYPSLINRVNFEANNAGCLANGVSYYVCNISLTNQEPPVEAVYGDANGDGKVDLLDLVRAKKLAAGAEITAEGYEDYIANIDIDGDGDILADELIPLRKLILGVLTNEQYAALFDVE